jgi:hypothetical protein
MVRRALLQGMQPRFQENSNNTDTFRSLIQRFFNDQERYSDRVMSARQTASCWCAINTPLTAYGGLLGMDDALMRGATGKLQIAGQHHRVGKRRGTVPFSVFYQDDTSIKMTPRRFNMADLTLYHSPLSRSSDVLWILEEIGEPYNVHLLSYAEGASRQPDYLAVNPMGKVPALRHRGAIITETAAICTYLADAFSAGGPQHPAR